jgi:hypothetical protein
MPFELEEPITVRFTDGERLLQREQVDEVLAKLARLEGLERILDKLDNPVELESLLERVLNRLDKPEELEQLLNRIAIALED